MWNIEKIVSKGDYDYAVVKGHPYATKNGYVLLHRVIAENQLGRLLKENEVVHHIDRNGKNNSVENLVVLTTEQHNKLHSISKLSTWVRLRCPWCGKIFSKRKNKSFLIIKRKYNCTCCSNSCRGKLYREIQLHGLTPKVEKAISENLLLVYTKDNSEETDLQQVP